MFVTGCGPAPEIRVGSKKQPESVILGDMVAHLARDAGAGVDHRRGRSLSGTEFLWRALINDEIDVYPEYTGTISAEILAGRQLKDPEAMRQALAEHGIRMSQPLGFNDTYALGMKKETAQRLGIHTISDLRNHPNLRLAFSNEFMVRADDGWKGLRDHYGLPQKPLPPMEHDLAYLSLVNGAVDITDLYSTDAKIRSYQLQVLVDDRHFFPAYQAVLLYRSSLEDRNPRVVAAFLKLEGRISEEVMIDLNARVELDHQTESRVAADFLAKALDLHVQVEDESRVQEMIRLTREHLTLVAISLSAAIVIALPLGILAARWPRGVQGILGVPRLIQTVPSIALLMFLIPLLGIGIKPTIVALFLYSLLPIVQNTYTGLRSIPDNLRESAEALGLPAAARLRRVELPIASPLILAGIKTAAVINVGTATLGGLIGAGGFGEVIFNGIPKGDTSGLIIWGALPAAVLALVVLGVFEIAEHWLVPKGLRLKV
jgi:osmoprotectant transport system permease protein